MDPSPRMNQSMASSKTTVEAASATPSNLDDYIYDPKRTLYRHLSMEGKLATIFDITDSRSYYNWQLVMGNIRIHRRWFVPSPRFRELIDQELGMVAFEVTGDYDGSVSMICPSSEGNRSMAEELPIINFILTDMDCYSSVEITVVTINPSSIESGEYETNLRKIVARNYRSRTVINESVLKVHLKLRTSWNYAYMDLEELVKDAWGESYLVTKMVKINSNTRVRRVFFSDQLYSYEDLPTDFILEINPIPTTVEYFTQDEQYPPDRHPKLRKLYKTLRHGTHDVLTRAEYAKMMKMHRASHDEYIRTLAERQQDHVRGLTLALISKEDRSLPHAVKIKMGEANNLIPELMVTDAEISAVMDADAEAEAKRAEDERREIEKVEFCNTVWNRNPPPPKPEGGEEEEDDENDEEDEEEQEDVSRDQFVEWDLIASFDTKPQKLVQIHRQRRGEGFYDVYNGQMLETRTAQMKVAEMDAPNVIPAANPEDLLPIFREMLGVKKLEPYMQQRPGQKGSLVDPEADLEYLKRREAEMCNFRSKLCGKPEAIKVKKHAKVNDHEEDGDENQDDNEEDKGENEEDEDEDEEAEDGEISESEESIPCSEDSWVLTWTFDGMDEALQNGQFFDSAHFHQNSKQAAAVEENKKVNNGFGSKLPHRTFENHILK